MGTEDEKITCDIEGLVSLAIACFVQGRYPEKEPDELDRWELSDAAQTVLPTINDMLRDYGERTWELNSPTVQ